MPEEAGVTQEWLDAVAAQTEFAFVFVFWANDGAPLTWGGTLSPGNPVLGIAEADIGRALSVYARCSKRFEPGTPWLEYCGLGEIFLDDLPNWFGR